MQLFFDILLHILHKQADVSGTELPQFEYSAF